MVLMPVKIKRLIIATIDNIVLNMILFIYNGCQILFGVASPLTSIYLNILQP